jgi:uncharacterized protein YhaN
MINIRLIFKLLSIVCLLNSCNAWAADNEGMNMIPTHTPEQQAGQVIISAGLDEFSKMLTNLKHQRIMPKGFLESMLKSLQVVQTTGNAVEISMLNAQLGSQLISTQKIMEHITDQNIAELHANLDSINQKFSVAARELADIKEENKRLAEQHAEERKLDAERQQQLAIQHAEERMLDAKERKQATEQLKQEITNAKKRKLTEQQKTTALQFAATAGITLAVASTGWISLPAATAGAVVFTIGAKCTPTCIKDPAKRRIRRMAHVTKPTGTAFDFAANLLTTQSSSDPEEERQSPQQKNKKGKCDSDHYDEQINAEPSPAADDE